MVAIAILDDYQNVALSMADWSGLQKNHRIAAFNERLPDVEAAARALAEFEIVGIMRERTPFQRALFEKLPKLKLLVTTGKRNASIDLEAAKAHGVTVCNTGGAGRATAELTVGLMIALARHFREEFHTMRLGGGWQTTLGIDLEGRTLGLLGLGNLGAKVGRIGAAMGMQVIAWSQNLTPEQAKERGAERVEKDELFRRSDVIVAGDVYNSDMYPPIDVDEGGSIEGEINALNALLDMSATDFMSQGGTMIVPGHGWISDAADVGYYRDMLIVLRDRVQAMIDKGMTLPQVKAAKPTLDFDPVYGREPGVTARFVEAVYRSLKENK